MPANINNHFIHATEVSSPEEEAAFIELENRLNARHSRDIGPVAFTTYEQAELAYRIQHPDHTRRSFRNI